MVENNADLAFSPLGFKIARFIHEGGQRPRITSKNLETARAVIATIKLASTSKTALFPDQALQDRFECVGRKIDEIMVRTETLDGVDPSIICAFAEDGQRHAKAKPMASATDIEDGRPRH